MFSYYVRCPTCGARVELPDDEPDDLFKVTDCWECSASFDYDPGEVVVELREPYDVEDHFASED